MDRPSVMHIVDSLVPYGAERFVMDLCVSLRERYAPVVLAFGGGALERDLAQESIPFMSMSKRELDDRSLRRRFAFCWSAVRHHRPHLVHAHSAYGNLLGRIAAHLQGIPSVGHFHGVEGRWGTTQQRIAYKIAQIGRTRLVAVSGGMAAEVERTTGLRPCTIHNAVDEEKLRAQSRESGSLHREIGVAPETFLVGTVGRIEEIKNYPALLRCAQRVCKAKDDVHFVCVGDGSLLGDMRRLRDDLGLSQRVHFLGYRDDVGGILHDIDVFCLMSRGEGFGLAIVEAMLMKCAVVATDVMGINEIVENDVQGFLVNDNGDEAAAERLLTLYDNRSLLYAQAEAGFIRAQTTFSHEALLGNIAAVYEELLQGTAQQETSRERGLNA